MIAKGSFEEAIVTYGYTNFAVPVNPHMSEFQSPSYSGVTR